MIRALPLAALAALSALSACKIQQATQADTAPAQGAAAAPAPAPPGAPPPPPPYQMRPEAGTGNRLAAANGEQAFAVHCGYCHLAGGMGTNLLTKQQLAAGQPPQMGLLANRTDLTADYVRAVVRQGKNAMPAQTRVDITDAELDAVATYLGKGK